MNNTITICSVTHNCLADLPPFFASLDELRGDDWHGDDSPNDSLEPAFSVVIVDSGSSDGTESWLQRAACRWPLRVEHSAANIGFAAATNRAIALAPPGNEWLLFLNVDALSEPGAPTALRRAVRGAMQQGLRTAAATGRLVRPKAPGQGSRLDACGMFLAPSWRHFDRGSEEPDRGQYNEAEEVFGGTGAATLFRREALEDVAIDGRILDEDFFTFREDAELCLRLQERGWSTVFEPGARFVHRRSNTPGRRRQINALLNFHTLKNRYLLRLYHQTRHDLPRTLFPSFARDIGILLYVLLKERTSLGAYAWLWAQRKRLIQRRRFIRARCTHPRRVAFWFRHQAVPIPELPCEPWVFPR